MTINTLIDNLAQIARMEERRPGLEVAAVAAEAEVGKMSAGYKLTVARCKAREAAAAITDLDKQIEELKRQTPNVHESTLYFAKRYAAYTLKREKLESTTSLMEKQLADALEEAKKGAWKWQGRKDAGEPAPVVIARKQVAAVAAELEELEKYYTGTKVIIEDHRAEELKDIEFKAWLAGGAKPEFVRLEQEKERMELLKGCVVLKLAPAGGPYVITATPIADTEEVLEGAEDPDWWCMTMDDYITKHVAPPKWVAGKFCEDVPVKKEEKPIVYKNKTVSWIAGFVKRRDELKAK